MTRSIETCRKMSAARLGKPLCQSAKDKLKGRKDSRGFPPMCIKCVNRDVNTCAKFNMSCFKARECECFKRQMKRREHPDYHKVGGRK
jgi:hypothetical protein